MKYNKIKWADAPTMGDPTGNDYNNSYRPYTQGKPSEIFSGMPEKSYGALDSIRMPRKC